MMSFIQPSILKVDPQEFEIVLLDNLPMLHPGQLEKLPFSIRILLEGLARNFNNQEINPQTIENLANWVPNSSSRPSIPFYPSRVIMQDFSGVPVLVDLAAIRDSVARTSGNPERVNPVIPVDLVIDHSVQVDCYGTTSAFAENEKKEFHRNMERYQFLHWSQKAFNNLRIIPPSSGIVHQINLEYLTNVVFIQSNSPHAMVFPDTVVGTDSHTTMINGMGVLGWGIGGIEALAVMLNQPIEIPVPDVVGVRLSGKLPEGTTPTDLTLTITQILRQKGVVDKFVEFFGTGLNYLPLTDRAMISNMAPEYGATVSFFPVDNQTIDYLKLTGRPAATIALVEKYYKTQGLFRTDDTPDPLFSEVIELSLDYIEPSLAGPKRPQDRIPLYKMKESFNTSLRAPVNERGFGLSEDQICINAEIEVNNSISKMRHGSVVIAAITSCTNTSDPFVMIGAGLLAKKAVKKGLKVSPYVKTSLAPGSRVVIDYLNSAGLLPSLNELGFNLVAYGCTTCIGNTGPLETNLSKLINQHHLVTAAVLSGNRNFEGRISPDTRANYLASPILVIAYALAGTVDIDFRTEEMGIDKNGVPVFLRDIYPSSKDIQAYIEKYVQPELFTFRYKNIFQSNIVWNNVKSPDSLCYKWDPKSTYIQKPPYILPEVENKPDGNDINAARVLALFGDSITTDHISPAGEIAIESPAGKYLLELGVKEHDFNSYGSRRGNDRVMVRGTFANIRLKNMLLPGTEGGMTAHFPDEEIMSIYDAAMRYKAESIPLIILAGKEYGTGSSRDWAAKGSLLLGIKAIIAESFERIHKSNLVGMGILPLQFMKGDKVDTLGLTGKEKYTIVGLNSLKAVNQVVMVEAETHNKKKYFSCITRLDTDIEIRYFLNSGVLPTIINSLLM